jgi:hypothetical protein
MSLKSALLVCTAPLLPARRALRQENDARKRPAARTGAQRAAPTSDADRCSAGEPQRAERRQAIPGDSVAAFAQMREASSIPPMRTSRISSREHTKRQVHWRTRESIAASRDRPQCTEAGEARSRVATGAANLVLTDGGSRTVRRRCEHTTAAC